MEFPVEEKKELVLGMLRCDALQRFVGEPADAFEFVFDEEAGVDGDLQRSVSFAQRTEREFRFRFRLIVLAFEFSLAT